MTQTTLLNRLGRFDIRKHVGRGGFGDVYLAHDPEHSRKVALKVLRLREEDADIRQAEENGASIQQQIHSVAPQVAEVFEYGDLDGYFYIAMEYVAGKDLYRILKEPRPFGEDRAVDVACQLCEMLEQTHGYQIQVDGREVHGVVHGDLKPDNIRLQDGDRVRVLDFGIAKFLSGSRRHTQAHGLSIPYASPERLQEGMMDRRSDLWSVGVLLYEMVSGQRPFEGRSDYDLERAIVYGSYNVLPQGCCSRALEAVIYRTLERDFNARFDSAAELKAALEDSRNSSKVDERTRRSGSRTDPRLRQPGTGEEERTRRSGSMTDPRRHSSDPAEERTRRSGTTEENRLRDSQTRPSLPSEPLMPGQEHPWLSRRQSLGRRALMVLVALFLLSQAVILGFAGQLRKNVRSSPRDLDAHLERYQTLDTFDVLGLPLLPARGTLREALVNSANLILREYEVDSPRPDLPWSNAARYLEAARALGADEPEVQARILYCKGHLARIEAKDFDNRNEDREAVLRRNEAVSHFLEAARLDPDWYAPQLGLARIYAYDDFDLMKMLSALDEAEKLGFTPGRRETAQKADGYHRRCRDLRNQAGRALSGDKKNILKEAREHCRSSIRLYNDIIGFANAEENMQWAQRDLRRVESDLQSLGVD